MAADDTHPRRRDAAATRSALLSATRELLAERGAAHTTTRDIAAVVGVNQALINRYFGSKEELFVEAVRSGTSSVDDVVASAPLDEIAAVMLREVLEVSASGKGTFELLAGVVNNEMMTVVIRDMIESRITKGLGDRLAGPDGALRAELLNALILGVVVMRQKIATSALENADLDRIADYVTRMADPVLNAD
ncbi:TetR/AcrR family transcriptional regulator [Aldersonia sp. NBC_00410]|uniref:TetR/AcrR family transcriptional regulator n=1 Tax=Aldersonia sp. NBC_00410 TaxID=2975954 RepID=UPI002253075A|nr:TetR/AcrR family transcriptional regulator [Aldersonia sp. NBC_00410]MCX5045427.1 TetR/AcrR family transcriptional regulator [Aldersonia sp. NBC_00410]